MFLTNEEQKMLDGEFGYATQKSMEILAALGDIFGAEKMVPVTSVQIAGVSYHNLGDAGLAFLEDFSRDGKTRVLTTLNPAGMDLENWKNLGISEEFAGKQEQVIDAFKKFGVITTCTCTPYLIGNLPSYGQHIAWSESSAVSFANSVIGARTNREGGPSALASSLTGKTPAYGLHLAENRQPKITVDFRAELKTSSDFGAAALAIGKIVKEKIPLIRGIKNANVDQLKNFSASFATYSGTAMYNIESISPDRVCEIPEEVVTIEEAQLKEAVDFLNDDTEVDFVSIGCPHCSINEIAEIAKLLKGKKVTKETWITTARPMKQIADNVGYSKIIEESGAKFACDTCLAVAPLKGRFKAIATNSAKGCYYGRGSNGFKTRYMSLEKCVEEATK